MDGGGGERPARKEGREISERRRGRFTTAGRGSVASRSVDRRVTREGGARSPSRITDRREGGREGRRKVVESTSPSPSPSLPNYYLVIFLSECSVNALHRNTANRGGWIDRPSVASKVSVMWTLHLKNIRSVASQTNAIKAEGTLCKAAAAARSPKQG